MYNQVLLRTLAQIFSNRTTSSARCRVLRACRAWSRGSAEEGSMAAGMKLGDSGGRWWHTRLGGRRGVNKRTAIATGVG